MGRLSRLLSPRSIAVVGGGAWCEQIILQNRKLGFAGDLHIIHPTKDEIAGLTPLRRLADLPAPPDAVFIGVNRHATIEVVAELSAIGAGGAICFASGFRETADGDDLQTALLDAAASMPIIGPNCYGFLNYLDRAALWPDQHGGLSTERGVALITQSSNIAINLTMQTRGIPLAYVVTVGNQAQTGLSEVGAALLDDPRVTALGLHIEGIDDLAAFAALAQKAHAIGKPIVALKVGQSDHAQTATVSHTASLAGSDAGADALFAKLGIGRVRSLSALLETLKLLHVTGPLPHAGIAAMSCSGGEASLIADAAHGSSVGFPDLTDAQKTILGETLGPLVTLSNPLDYHTFIWGDEDAMARAFAAMMSDRVALGIVVLDFPRPDRCTSPDWALVVNAVERAQAEKGKPIAVLSSLTETMPEAVAQDMIARGILPLCGMVEAIEAVATAANIGGAVTPPLLPPKVAPGSVLTEADAKAALARYSVAVPRSEAVAARHDLPDAARRIGYPVVLKGQGVAHKTEAGAVAIGLADESALMAAAAAMPTESFLVEAMVMDAKVELLLGVVLDPAHGYVLTLGAGGTLTEIMNDSTSLLLPVTDDDIRSALDRLAIAPLLHGYRGSSSVDAGAIVATVLSLQDYVQADHPFEVEINPLMCGPDGATAADALITTGEPHD
ncbi:MAG: acetate--CoA ligase family protein [Pseudomonadota bacterium]